MSSRANSAIFNPLPCRRGLLREVAILLIILLLLPAISLGFASFTRAGDIPAVKLTAEERTWLENNPEKLTLLFNIEFPPIEFSSASGTFIGMGADIISMEGIPSLRVAGKTDYALAWSIGVSRKYPLLYSSIQKALDTIPKSEIDTIRRRWISLDISGWLDPETRRLLHVVNVFISLFIIGLLSISYFLRRRLKEKVTALKTARQELLDQSELLRLAAEAANAGLWDYRPAMKTGYLSSHWFALLGYPPADKKLPLAEIRKFMHPEDRPRVDRSFRDYITGGGRGLLEIEFRQLRADGTWCWVLSKSKAVEWDEKGVPSRIIGLDLNIQTIKEAQEAMVKSEAKFRAIFENAPYPIVITALEDGRYLEANKSFLDSRGISREELLGLRTEDFAFIREEETADVIDTLMKTGSVKNRETTVGKKDGTNRHITYSSILLEIQGQKQILSMTVDVTERKRAEEALKESEARFRSLFMNAPIPLINLTLEGKVIAVNDRLSQVLGYTIDDVPNLEQAWKLALPDPDLRGEVTSKWRTDLERAIADNTDMESFECPIRCKDGTVHTMVVGTKLISNSINVSFFDITEWKKAEEARDFERRQLLSIFDSLNELIYVSDPFTYKILFSNRRLQNLIGKDPTGGICYKELQGFDQPCDFCTNSIILNSGGMPYKWEFHNTLMNVDVEIVDQIIRWPDGRDVRLEIAGDITERKQTEKEQKKLQGQLLQSQKLEAVGVLAGGVAHDFNNMLGAIIGYTELTLGEMDPADPFRKNLDRILDAAQRSVNLTRQLLAFARKQTIEPKVFDLNESVETMLKMIRRLIGENIELSWLPGSGACAVRMDPSQLDQILVNLCVNAKDAITDVGRVSIETDTVSFDETYGKSHPGVIPGEYALLAVSDNGKGMDKETMNHIFEPFFTTKGVGQGTGLGLATVYGIVKQNEGFINTYSEPGKGTTFRIYIPLNAVEEVVALPQRAADIPRSRGETVLVVEDDPTLLEMSIKMLHQLGYSVLSAAAPNEAIRIAEENSSRIHLFITDVIMPEMNGRDLAERLTSIRPEMKSLFMSGYTADVIAHQGVLDEGVNFIQKPFSLKDLATRIREVLG